MYKRLSFIIATSLVLTGLFVFNGEVKSDTVATFNIVSGTDTTSEEYHSFTSSEVSKLSTSDNSRIQSDANWPMTGAYDESKYLEFIFSPDIPTGSMISSVEVTHEYYRTNALVGAKLEIWNGVSWHNVSISLPQSSGTSSEISETKDITSIISTIEQVNSIKIRFLAYRSTVVMSGIKTSHDFIQLSVNYSAPEATNSPSPEISDAPSPTPSPTETPSPPLTPTASPEPTLTPTTTPTSAPIIMINSVLPTIMTLASTILPKPIIETSSTPAPTETPTPKPLTANISQPRKIAKSVITTTPSLIAVRTPVHISPAHSIRKELSSLIFWLTEHIGMLKR